MTMDACSDHDLLQQWQAGDTTASNRLCRRYQDKLQRFFAAKVPPAEVAELIQQTWLAMSQAQHARRRAADSPTPLARFRAYLFGIARNVVLGYYNGRRRANGLDFDPDVESLESLEPSLSRVFSLERRAQRLELALHSLPLDLQLLFEGHYIEEIPGPELAVLFGIAEGTVRSRLWRARSLLNEALRGLHAPGSPAGRGDDKPPRRAS